MDITEVEENFFAASDAKLHGGMCKALSAIHCKVQSIFPSLEAVRPGSKSGIMALCSLHMALEKINNVLQHCSESSKLYLAITSEAVLLKFEKAKCFLQDSLRRVQDIVSQSVGSQIEEVLAEIEETVISLDPQEKQVGDDLISLIQQGNDFNNSTDCNELESFHQAATKLGVTSSRTALTERRALKKLIERARAEEDKRKESIVAYLLHLMRKYSKQFRTEILDENEQSSAPCSPTLQGAKEDSRPDFNIRAFEHQLSKLSSINFKTNTRRSRQLSLPLPLPPEELRCPISLQLMFDPVIIASGQTYERICIEKWLSDGHNTCPKTQQKLSYLSLTPNYCVKGLVTNWCEQNGVSVPDGPPDFLDLNYWRLSLSESKTANSKSLDSVGACKVKSDKVVPLEESGITEEVQGNENEPDNHTASVQEEKPEPDNVVPSYMNFLDALNEGGELGKKCKLVEKIRFVLKDDEEARVFMGANGFVEALLQFLTSAVREGNTKAQESGAMALFNLAVNNNRNKELMLEAGLIPLLEEMISNSDSHGSAAALYMNLSCLEAAKLIIGSSEAVPFITRLLTDNSDPQSKLDSLHALYHLSTIPSNIPHLLSSNVVSGLLSLLAPENNRHSWTEKSIAVLINLASSQPGRDELITDTGVIGRLATVVDSGEAIEQEQAVSCLLILCNQNEKCSDMVLQEGVIPGLVSMSVNGTSRGKEKARRLLMLFREQRQREQLQPQQRSVDDNSCNYRVERRENPFVVDSDTRPLSKSTSRRTLGRAFSFLKKSKSYSFYRF